MNDRTILANKGGSLNSLFDKNGLPEDAHAGLVFSKFLNLWEGPASNPTKKESGDVLRDFVKAYNNRDSNKSIPGRLLSEIHQRMANYEEKCHMKSMRCKVGWRLACGTGIPNPVGNGFDFDPIIGVPIINGTAIKGLCRHSAKISGCDESELTRLFGPETIETGQTVPSTGVILFFDALPVIWPKLSVDIINCHHSSYYTRMGKNEQKNESDWPRETEKPVPVFFLTVDSKTEFIFRISTRDRSQKDREKALKDREKAFDFLSLGLEYFGIGAKTSVGYGVFDTTRYSS